MQKIAVCGDSYMAPVTNPAGSHFSELLAQRLGAELIYFARGGMSNGGIALQIQDAVSMRPDLILLDTSLISRVEFPIAQTPSQFHATDIVYAHTESVTSHRAEFNCRPNMISDTIISLLDLPESPSRWNNLYRGIPNFKEKIEALKQYVTYLFDANWKIQVDKWCMYAVLHQLEMSGVPYVIVHDQLGIRNFPWINQRNYIGDKIYNYYKKMPVNFWKTDLDPGYHTTPEIQIEICQEIYIHLKQWKFINE